MNFDVPMAKPWENKKSPNFKKWLIDQIQRGPDRWDADFKSYIDLQAKESEGKELPERSREEARRETLKKYLYLLDLGEQEIKDKKILDLGSGEGHFVAECLERGITSEVHGRDIEPEGEALDPKYAKNFSKEDFQSELPSDSLDYVVSVGALSMDLGSEPVERSEKTLHNMISALKAGGEMRIAPIYGVVKGEGLEGVREKEQALSEILNKLEAVLPMSWELRPTDIQVTGQDKDVLLTQVLIIKKGN